MATIEELQAQIVSLGDQLRDISGYIEDPTLLKEENSQIQSYLADFTTKEGILLTIASLFSFLSFSDNNMFSHFLILTLPFLIFAIVFYILSTKRFNIIQSIRTDSRLNLLSAKEINGVLKKTYFNTLKYCSIRISRFAYFLFSIIPLGHSFAQIPQPLQ